MRRHLGIFRYNSPLPTKYLEQSGKAVEKEKKASNTKKQVVIGGGGGLEETDKLNEHEKRLIEESTKELEGFTFYE